MSLTPSNLPPLAAQPLPSLGAAGPSQPSQEVDGKRMRDMDLVVFEYLKTRGYVAAAQMLQATPRELSVNDMGIELQLETMTSIHNVIRTYNAKENSALWYDESYSSLYRFIMATMPPYRVRERQIFGLSDWLFVAVQDDLQQLIWPLAVHFYLDLLTKGFKNEGLDTTPLINLIRCNRNSSSVLLEASRRAHDATCCGDQHARQSDANCRAN